MKGEKVKRKIAWMLAALLAARFAWVVATFAHALPEGPWPAAGFGLAALTACLAPGLALLRLGRIRLPPLEATIFIVATGLAATGLGAWALYAVGCYTRAATLATLAVFACAGVWGASPFVSRKALGKAAAYLRAVPAGAWVAPLVAALFVEGVFEGALGTPFQEWDALVSWDEWASEMGTRTCLGPHLFGGYPQFLPALRSVFYKVAVTPPGAVFPPEHLMLHGFDAIFPALLALSLFALGRRHGFPALLALGLLAANDRLFADLASGQADVPLAALATALAALLPCLATRGGWRVRAPLALLFLALMLAKGTGGVLALPLLAYAWAQGGRPALRQSAAAAGLALALALPFLFQQLWLAAHPAVCAPSPHLLTFAFHAAHTRLFTPNANHLAEVVRRLVASRAVPDGSMPALAVLAAAFLAALAQRRTRPAALLLAALLVFWFFTASYDWRNAYPALVLGACVLAASAWPARASQGEAEARGRARTPFGRLATLALVLSLSLLAFAGSVRTGAFGALRTPVHRWQPPKATRLPPGLRHQAMRPAGDLRNILFAAPWASRARHIWTGDPLYRLLAPKGCYAIHVNRWHDAQPGDLFVGTAAMPAPSDGFVPLARLRRTPGYQSIWIYRPDLVPGLVLERPAPPAGDEAPGREAFGTDAEGDPFAPYLAPYRDGGVIRLPNPAR